jgi:type IV secretion system protein VirB9
MMRLLFACVLALPVAAAGQVLPRAEGTDPRLQTIAWIEGREVTLTAMPKTALTVMLEPGEKVLRVTIEDEARLTVQVSSERDSLLLLPQDDLEDLRLRVQTDRRTYPFRVQTEASLLAAYLVRFTHGPAARAPGGPATAGPTGGTWTYRLKGDASVFPASITDDGVRTTIAFGPDQPLPAIFAIGPTGEEEVVNGYMRGGHFVIDRVYRELVFRIDDDRARALRALARSEG